MSDRPLREFLYLDTERVRSYLAQLHEGVPETATSRTQNDAGFEGEAEGGVPLVAKGKVAAKDHYVRGQDETKSLHHHAYTLFETHLSDSKRLRPVDAAFTETQWSPTVFSDGEIVRVTGEVRIIDYGTVVDTVRGLPGFVTLMGRMAKATGQGTPAGSKGGQQQPKIDLGIDKKDIDTMAQLIERTFGDTVRVKIRPSADAAPNTFAAVALRTGFQDGLAAVQQSHGLDLGPSWVVVGQVNAPRPDPTEDAFAAFTTGNEIEDQSEQLVFAMDAIRRLSSGVTYPCVSMNLISIYREC